MDKKIKIFLIVLGCLILLGILYNRFHKQIVITSTTTTSGKAVVVKQPQYQKKYGYVPPPPSYNPYKAQYYN